ncbi:hypothetical protein RRG08_054697 [Elysia crispata]|uniref:protein-histidine N-methyltransferase n=1 Tax=Elysia crispata TaxID=231223 RepID=A0AAE1B0Y0_9GAST|nr:hypothetical protein RRG08_054697 [Elysia crispata]
MIQKKKQTHSDPGKFESLQLEFGQQCLKVVDTRKLGNLILKDEKFRSFADSKNLVAALSSNSDLVAGIYEGGLKMWECGEDLVHFLSSHPVGQAIELKGKFILELGCGAGLPGIYCCSCGAKAVHFQDFNEEVLQLVTHTNATYNITESKEVKCRYLSGDWSSLSQLLQKEKQIYDVILTAETIYSPENYSSLHDVFHTSLSANGVVVVAAKVYYFGVGGGTDGFIEYVESQKCFTAEVVHTIKAAVPRKIILLHRQKSNPGSR